MPYYDNDYCPICGEIVNEEKSVNDYILSPDCSYFFRAHKECLPKKNEANNYFKEESIKKFYNPIINNIAKDTAENEEYFNLICSIIKEKTHYKDDLQLIVNEILSGFEKTRKNLWKSLYTFFYEVEKLIEKDIPNKPFKLYIIDVINLQISGEKKYASQYRVDVISQIQKRFLPKKGAYIVLWFSNKKYSTGREINDNQNVWYVESKQKGTKIADIDVPLSFQAGLYLEKYQNRISEVYLGSGDKDFQLIGERCKDLNIPFNVIIMDKKNLSRELELLADSVQTIF